MKEKIKKLLFEYSINSRISTKELGKKIRASQQSASYLKNQLIKKKLIQPTTIVDSVKLGYINVLVGFNFLKPETSLKKEIIDELKQEPAIIQIEEANEGIDIIVIYSISNLSAFNKVHSELVHKNFKKLQTTFVFPMIVSHEFPKNYLVKNPKEVDIVLSGDRTLKELKENETKILNQLIENPSKRLIDLATSLKIPVKTIMRLKKSLERKFIIKGYTSILDNKKLGINRQIIFLRFTSEGMNQVDKFSNFAKFNKNIVQLTKTIGSSQIIIIAENLGNLEIIKDIRTNFPIENYLIAKSEKIHKKTYLPIIKQKLILIK